MRKITLTFFFLIPFLLSAQTNRVVVVGEVTDILYKSIPFATIQVVGTNEGANADYKGHYIFNVTLPATLKVSCIGYKTELKKISRGRDSILIDFTLTVDSAQIQQVEVTATHEPELVKESGVLRDFETNENKVWLLYHYKDGDHLEIYDAEMKSVSRIILKHRSDNLTKTPYNYLFIENPDSVRLFDYDSVDKVIDVGGVTPSEFHGFLNHLATYHNPYYYYKWSAYDSSFISYSYIDKSSSKNRILYYYRNIFIARENEDIVPFIYKFKQPAIDSFGMPIATPEAMGEHKSKESELARSGRGLLYYRSLFQSIFCPLRIIRDSIYIFNFDNDSIYVYDFNNTKIRQMPLYFQMHGFKYSKQDILVNEEGNECYYKFAVGGEIYLQKIDLNTGTKMNTQKLAFSFPEKIRIMAGYAYYTYSENFNNGMFDRHLYRQKL